MNRNYGKWFLTNVKKAIIDYKMIEDGDVIAIGVSGGKDSSALLFMLDLVRKHSPFPFEMIAITIDLGFGMDFEPVRNFCNQLSIPYHIEKTHIGKIVFDIRKESNPCSLCAKMRRGALVNAAKKLGCNKIALGHHGDDAIETLFLNLLFTGRLDTFLPSTHLSRKNLAQIRPLIYLSEQTVKSVVYAKKLPVISNLCPVSGSTERNKIKTLIDQMEDLFPTSRANILSALKRRKFVF